MFFPKLKILTPLILKFKTYDSLVSLLITLHKEYDRAIKKIGIFRPSYLSFDGDTLYTIVRTSSKYKLPLN